MSTIFHYCIMRCRIVYAVLQYYLDSHMHYNNTHTYPSAVAGGQRSHVSLVNICVRLRVLYWSSRFRKVISYTMGKLCFVNHVSLSPSHTHHPHSWYKVGYAYFTGSHDTKMNRITVHINHPISPTFFFTGIFFSYIYPILGRVKPFLWFAEAKYWFILSPTICTDPTRTS